MNNINVRLIPNQSISVKLKPAQGIRVDLDTVYVYDDTSIGDGVLTLQKNGETLDTFTANSKVDKTVNITVPTKTSDLTNDDGFITGIISSDITTALGYTPYNSSNPSGFITGITSSDVITALGYTPYDSSNPNGYTSNIGTVTSVNNVSPVNGNVTLSIPSEVTESTVSSWGFTKNTGTVTSVNNISPVNGNVSLTIPTVNNPTITFTQGGVEKGSITLNQSSNETISLDAGSGGGGTWGSITGTLSDQVDLKNALDAKVSLNGTETITNKTIDADDNTIQDLEVDNFKSGVIRTTVRTNLEGASDLCVPTEKAVYTSIMKKGTYTTDINPTLIQSGGICTWEIDYSSYTAMAFPANIQVYQGDKQILVDIENDTVNLKYKIKILSTNDISSGTLYAMIIHQ